MVDVIVYKPSPYGLVFIHDKPLRLRPQVYHISHQTWAGYVSYKHEPEGRGFMHYHINHERVHVL